MYNCVTTVKRKTKMSVDLFIKYTNRALDFLYGIETNEANFAETKDFVKGIGLRYDGSRHAWGITKGEQIKTIQEKFGSRLIRAAGVIGAQRGRDGVEIYLNGAYVALIPMTEKTVEAIDALRDDLHSAYRISDQAFLKKFTPKQIKYSDVLKKILGHHYSAKADWALGMAQEMKAAV